MFSKLSFLKEATNTIELTQLKQNMYAQKSTELSFLKEATNTIELIQFKQITQKSTELMFSKL
jgi:hypothetical protein